MTHALFGLESDNCAQCGSTRDEQDFARFYARFQPRLLRYASRVWGARDAEEIAQETLVRAYEAIDLNRDERSLWGWLVVVGRNVAADLARARRVCDVGGEGGPHEATIDPKCVEQTVLDSECLSTLGLALSALPPSQSRAWWLSVAEGMTPAGIAESLACSPEAVRQALFKSRKRLKAAMAEFCDRTAAITLPVVVLVRRGSDRLGRVAAPATANGFLSAAMISTTALTMTVIAGATPSSPAVASPRLPMTIAAESHRADLDPAIPALHQRARTGSTAGASRASGAAPSTAQASTMPVAQTRLSSHPLAPGEEAHEHISVDTPVGTFVIDQGAQRSPGEGLVCGRVKQVHCS